MLATSISAGVCFRGLDLQAQSYVAVPVGVEPLENVRHALETDAGLDKEIEAEPLFTASAAHILCISVEEQLYKLRAEPVAESDQGITELGKVDVATAVQIEAVEEPSPGGQEAPQAAELVKVDGAGSVGIKHANHHTHSMRIKGSVVAIHKSATQGVLTELAGAVGIDRPEEWP